MNTCSECPKVFNRTNALEKHLRIHRRYVSFVRRSLIHEISLVVIDCVLFKKNKKLFKYRVNAPIGDSLRDVLTSKIYLKITKIDINPILFANFSYVILECNPLKVWLEKFIKN